MACRLDGAKPLSDQCWNTVNWTLRTNFSEILIWIQTFSFKKMRLKMASAKWRPFCLSLNELTRDCPCDLTTITPDEGTTRARFLSLTLRKRWPCSSNHRAGYFSNLTCGWPSIVWAYFELALWRTAPGDAVLERSIENRCIKKSEGTATQHANLGTKQVVSLCSP